MSHPFVFAAEPTPTPVTHLSGDDTWFTLAVVVAFVLLAGVVIAGGRRWLAGTPTGSSREQKTDRPQGDDGAGTLVRSWLAISLVGGLLIFAALSFWIDDATMRSTLIGGLVANAGAAVAFYFASKESDQARRDILNASLPSTLVPDLLGKNVAATRDLVAAARFRLATSPVSPRSDAQVAAQDPGANQPAPAGTAVVAVFAGPVPDLTGRTLDEAKDLLAGVDLELVEPPSAPAPGAQITDQSPKVGENPPADRRITVTF